jgi:hypothetical protein
MPVFTQGEEAKAAAIETAFTAVDTFLAHVESVLKDSGYLVRVLGSSLWQAWP